jgi:rhodanese-related sulfurtransferase
MEAVSSDYRGGMDMIPALIVVAIIIPGIAYWFKRNRDLRELEQYSITPEALHALLDSNHETLVVDVRLPLDLLVDSEIIPGAKRIAPKEVIENPALIPQDRDTILYCTCPSDKSSRRVLRKALAANFTRTKFLRGGLEGWKAKGYPVEPYTKSFHLDTAS